MSNTAIMTFPSALDYGVVSSAPPIRREDIAAWKTRVSPDVAQHFVERYQELERAYHELIAEYNTNALIYNSTMSFVPVVGHTYYLYEKNDGQRFLSLVAPQHSFWSGFLGAFRLTTPYTWTRVDT
jgi:hypothetical protein